MRTIDWPLSLSALALVACGSPTYTARVPDLTEALGPDESRAGVITDEAALFGGVSAEGRLGDVKLYNDRVRFVIQAARDGSFYIRYGGGVIDADVVRPDGVPGRDLIDEFTVMVGLGRLLEADQVTVLSDGRDGLPAVVRVNGHGAPMELLTGALESPDFVDDRDVDIVTDYILEPGSPLLKMVTTITWNDAPERIQAGDLSMVSFDVGELWHPRVGLDGDGLNDGSWLGFIGKKNEVAVALMSGDAPFPPSTMQDLLSQVGPVLVGLEAPLDVTEGQSWTLVRYLGVGDDLAMLTDAWQDKQGADTVDAGGVVLAGGEPVAGARVHISDAAGLPWTLAFTDADGQWSAQIPAGGGFTAVATGRGPAEVHAHPAGAAWYGPYAATPQRDLALATMQSGAPAIPFAEGYGESASVAVTADTTLDLTPPGWITVDIADGGTAVVRIDFAAGDPAAASAERLPGRPSGAQAWGYARGGSVRVPVEPGDYVVTVHRGLAWEAVTRDVSIASDEDVSLSADLQPAYAHPGVLLVDPHSHAAPSGDGEISMEDRLSVHAAHGVQVHFGTDHDHVADYRPLLSSMGLDGTMASIVADEVSPVMRGHFNAYPLTEAPDLTNNGAPAWWEQVWSTNELFDQIFAMDEDVLVQVNHPAGNKGMFGFSDYDVETGEVGQPDNWDDRFEVLEVLNDGDIEEFLPFYLDVLSRGLEPTPVGVSDSHGHRGGVGESLTFLYAGTDDPQAFDNDTLRTSMRAHATVPSRGPLIMATVDGEWAPGRTIAGPVTLDVALHHPSWMQIDRISLLENGAVAQTVDVVDGGASFDIDPAEDAHYIVVAEGDSAMAPVYPSLSPWAMTAAMRIDVAGDGWDAPLPGISF